MTTNITRDLPDIAPPPGAARIGAWCETTTPAPFRYVEGVRGITSNAGTGPSWCTSRGFNGATAPWRRGSASTNCAATIQSPQPRQIARALVAAADSVDRMTEWEQ